MCLTFTSMRTYFKGTHSYLLSYFCKKVFVFPAGKKPWNKVCRFERFCSWLATKSPERSYFLLLFTCGQLLWFWLLFLSVMKFTHTPNLHECYKVKTNFFFMDLPEIRRLESWNCKFGCKIYLIIEDTQKLPAGVVTEFLCCFLDSCSNKDMLLKT